MTYAFRLDAAACTGCKACQVACKDENDLPTGMLWRRVYEVGGGSWARCGEAWTNDVFAWSLSLACNHCVHPKCAGVCPTDAYLVRPDGIVTIQAEKCTGCGYCAWACPYDAPQLDPGAGRMTKCHLCAHRLDLGLPPACVAACPLRCLELVQVDDAAPQGRGMALWHLPGEEHPFPLPAFSRTEPHLLLLPHPASGRSAAAARVNNREEIAPLGRQPVHQELPLLAFSLLAQGAAGLMAVVFLLDLYLGYTNYAGLTLPPLLTVGGLLTAALAVAFLHLGTPGNAWRMLAHLQKSWLSREVLCLSAFGVTWALAAGLRLLGVGAPAWSLVTGLSALCGAAVIQSMHQIYRLRSVPAWNTVRTLAEFVLTALSLGCLLTALLLPVHAVPAQVMRVLIAGALAAFSGSALLCLAATGGDNRRLSLVRLGLAGLGIAASTLLLLLPAPPPGVMAGLFLLALIEQALGRWLFYDRRKPNL